MNSKKAGKHSKDYHAGLQKEMMSICIARVGITNGNPLPCIRCFYYGTNRCKRYGLKKEELYPDLYPDNNKKGD